jgi:hypothetical protein
MAWVRSWRAGHGPAGRTHTVGAGDGDGARLREPQFVHAGGRDPDDIPEKGWRQANVGALRAKATDVDVSIRPRKEWARLYAEKQLEKA